MTPAEWAVVLQREYLADFIKAGGASVKFAVPLDDLSRVEVERVVRDQATVEGYLVLDVNAAGTRVHMIDQVFNRLAEQVPWRQLCRGLLGSLARCEAFVVPDDDGGPFLDALAAANDIDREFLRAEMRRVIVNNVYTDTAMAKDFRVAMTGLMLAELTGRAEGETTFQVVGAWLTGDAIQVTQHR